MKKKIDDSNNYFNGLLEPLNLAAKFGVYNNIEVRKKWDVEGIILEIN